MREGVILNPCIEMFRKVVCGQKAMMLFLCFEAEFQFEKPLVFLKQPESFSAREVLSVLTDIPDDVSEYGDKSCRLVADDDFIPAADESSSSSEDENVNAASI